LGADGAEQRGYVKKLDFSTFIGDHPRPIIY
jgi:hypothetical protein